MYFRIMNEFIDDVEIARLVANWDVSDDDLDFSDEDDMFYEPSSQPKNYLLVNEYLDIDNLPILYENEGEYVIIPQGASVANALPDETQSNLPSSIPDLPLDTLTELAEKNKSFTIPTVQKSISNRIIKPNFLRSSVGLYNNNTKSAFPKIIKKTQEFLNLKWKEGNLVTCPSLLSHNEKKLNNNITEMTTPYQFFSYFFDENILTKIKHESELYASQININSSYSVSTNELKRYLGICIYNSLCIIPNIRDYWSDHLGIPHVYNSLSQKRFEEIRRYFHFNDNTLMLSRNDPNYDRLHKIRPIIDHLNNKFNSIPHIRDLSIDEQLCATKGKSYLKQYMPAKPHKWGYKLFVLCDVNGFSYQFEIYSGQENEQRFRLVNEPDLGACGNIVLRLTRNVDKNKNHRLYFDNYYTSIPLMSYLYGNGIMSLGTVRKDRLPNNTLPNEKVSKLLSRGKSFEYISTYQDAPISVTWWKDNKPVNMLSTYCGSLPMLKTQRFDKKAKKKIEVDCPNVIKEYNRFMGGVDLLDSLIGRYKIRMRTRKWFMRLFYHMVDMSIVNSWLLYKRTKLQLGEPVKYTLVEWRKDLAFTLTRQGFQKSTRGRRSTSFEQSLKKINRTRPTVRPTKDVRLDKCDHFPKTDGKRGRCKYPNCSGYTSFKCTKCLVYLCVTKTKNCFYEYHC